MARQSGHSVEIYKINRMKFETLKRRADFLHVKGGARWVTPGFTLQARRALDVGLGQEVANTAPGDLASRVGFTVTKRIGNAVIRNRIKRRLREVVRENAGLLVRSGTDYVVIARQGVEMRRYNDLCKDFKLALKRVHGKLPHKSDDVSMNADPSV